ncbi:MAG: methyltransferase domain-containing protein [Candidatus Zixiibacteriota bacterium]|nr:MAG: methyltransferase domain-containing protein [candidate division Zixibacteria bacterium]
MAKEFSNVYDDNRRAESYAKLEFPGTYYLAYRDLPQIISRHITGRKALDFGCGTGRSTRFLKKLGFDAVGVDIAADMIRIAQEFDPKGTYYLIEGAGLGRFKGYGFDLALSVFTFDNIAENKVALFKQLRDLLNDDGKIISVVSSPDIYKNEWASFTTKDFPENLTARSGDKVRIIMTDVEDRRPVEDIVWSDDAYREVYKQAGLELVETYKPLGNDDDPVVWVNETKIAPWVIYVLK